jgi:hypothetical protein
VALRSSVHGSHWDIANARAYWGFAADLKVIQNWPAELVVSMTTLQELRDHGATDLADDLLEAGIKWLSVPVSDFGAPISPFKLFGMQCRHFSIRFWRRAGGFCFIVMGAVADRVWRRLRVMVESGMDPDAALAALRDVRPCAVETPKQQAWASQYP